MVSHAEIPALRHLIGKLDVAVAKRLFCHIRLVELLAVNIDRAVGVDIYPLPRSGNAALDENLISEIKRNQIALLKVRAFERDDDVSFRERRRHRRAVDLQHRRQYRRHQHSQRRHDNQHIHRAAQRLAVAPAIAKPLALGAHLLDGRHLHRLLFLPPHTRSPYF